MRNLNQALRAIITKKSIFILPLQPTQGENADENEAVLDEEMAKVFAEPNLSKFDVRRLSEVKPPSSSKLDKEYQQSQQAHSDKKYNEQDYDCKSNSVTIVDGI